MNRIPPNLSQPECRKRLCAPLACRSKACIALLCLAVVSLLHSGCISEPTTCGRCLVSSELARRTQHSLGSQLQTGTVAVPQDVVLDDGLSEHEAVALAIHNNAAFQATLTRIGVAQGDVIQAGLLTNPDFSTYMPVGPKAWEFTLTLPIEALLVRPRKVSLASCEYNRVGQELVQNGLDLIRDVRVAYAEYALALHRSALADRAVETRERIAELTNSQFQAGAISELETISARVDVHRAKADAAAQKQTVAMKRERLRSLLGLALSDVSVQIDVAQSSGQPVQHANALLNQDTEVLMSDALECRPDLQAANLAVAAAKERAELARWAFLSFGVSADANSPGRRRSFEFGPGIALRLPIFDRNQGGIVRADAEVDQAELTYEELRQRTATEIRNAHAQLQQASDNLAIVQRDVLPSLEQAIQLAEKAFASGGTSYLLYWQTAAQLIEAQARELDLIRDQRVAIAELERSVGRHLLEFSWTAETSEVLSEKTDEETQNHELVQANYLAADSGGWHRRMPR